MNITKALGAIWTVGVCVGTATSSTTTRLRLSFYFLFTEPAHYSPCYRFTVVKSL